MLSVSRSRTEPASLQSNHVNPGSKAALFHQGMFSLDIISTLLVKELHPDFLFFFLLFLHAARNKTGCLPDRPWQTEGHSLCYDPNQNNKKNNRFQDEFCIVCAGCYIFIYTLCVYSFAFLSRVESINSRCRASVTQRPLVAVHCTLSPRPPHGKSLVDCNQNLMGCRETSQRPTGTEPRSPLKLKKINK